MRHFREKRWCYAGLVSPELFFGVAVIHLGYITSAFAFGFDRATGRMTEHTITCPPLGHARFDRRPDQGTCAFRLPFNRFEIQSRENGLARHIRVNVRAPGKSIKADVTLGIPLSGFEAARLPVTTDAGSALTVKAAGLSPRGRIHLNDTSYSLEPDQSAGLLDWTLGAYPRHTFWNWACGAGTARDPNRATIPVGFNFSRGVYTRGEPENILWIDGHPEPCGPVDFRYDRPDGPFAITSGNGRIRLTFTPEGLRQANDDFGILASRFVQPLGKFEGEVTSRDGRTFTLLSVDGVTEEHYATW